MNAKDLIFRDRSINVHGNKYNYSKVKYINNSTKVCIICPKHGEFLQMPVKHINAKQGCPRCYNENRGNYNKSNVNEFIIKAVKIHGDKYDYSKVKYVNNHTKVCIICKEHGEFYQRPADHINSKQGCPKCNGGVNLTTEEFIHKAQKVHGDKYDYSKVDYKNNNTKVCIMCKKHGEFLQDPNNHINGNGCPKCNGGVNLTTEEFIEKAQKIHGTKYDYSKVKYINNLMKVCIICKEHGEFNQLPSSHLRGNGCQRCNASKLETLVEQILIKHKIEYISQYKPKWLGRQSLDFYLPKYNIGIECQGEQHFISKDYFGGINEYRNIINRDSKKLKQCFENNIRLLYFSNLGIEYPYKVFETEKDLIETIKKGEK